MADAVTKPGAVNLDVVRFLFWRSRDLTAFEDAMDRTSWQVAVSQQGERVLQRLIWSGLRYRDEKITLEKAGDMLDAARARGVSTVTIWQEVLMAMQHSGLLPPVVQDGRPTMTEGDTPAPSPGDTNP